MYLFDIFEMKLDSVFAWTEKLLNMRFVFYLLFSL